VWAALRTAQADGFVAALPDSGCRWPGRWCATPGS
jgi:hypothetical protein